MAKMIVIGIKQKFHHGLISASQGSAHVCDCLASLHELGALVANNAQQESDIRLVQSKSVKPLLGLREALVIGHDCFFQRGEASPDHYPQRTRASLI
jgi:hypothetical protein